MKKVNRIFMHFLISYIIFLFIPIIAGGKLFGETSKILSDYAKEKHSAILEQTMTITDEKLREIFNHAVNLGKNDKVVNIMERSAINDDTLTVTISKLID